eukprot:TRINITY_DN7207_c0_g2_i4.p1 TRINITY_DN7207_c0_g2~~TRINITY_DN7207_c0_g2_i4.p1  ORF type:complete len:320 (+),score=57.84 TRINITY_DN7207_c0_g2_i4:64-960(+)
MSDLTPVNHQNGGTEDPSGYDEYGAAALDCDVPPENDEAGTNNTHVADQTRYGSEENRRAEEEFAVNEQPGGLISPEPLEKGEGRSRSRSPEDRRQPSSSRERGRRRDEDYDDYDQKRDVRKRSRSPRERSHSRERSRQHRRRERDADRSRSFERRGDRRDRPRRERSQDRGGYGGGRRDRSWSPGGRGFGGGRRERSWSPGRGGGGIPNRTPPPGYLHLYVAGLQFDIRDKDLDRKFSRYGRIREARIVRNQRNGESKGFGFVVMETEDEVRDAIKSLDGSTWRGRRLIVERARTIK